MSRLLEGSFKLRVSSLMNNNNNDNSNILFVVRQLSDSTCRCYYGVSTCVLYSKGRHRTSRETSG